VVIPSARQNRRYRNMRGEAEKVKARGDAVQESVPSSFVDISHGAQPR